MHAALARTPRPSRPAQSLSMGSPLLTLRSQPWPTARRRWLRVEIAAATDADQSASMSRPKRPPPASRYRVPTIRCMRCMHGVQRVSACICPTDRSPQPHQWTVFTEAERVAHMQHCAVIQLSLRLRRRTSCRSAPPIPHTGPPRRPQRRAPLQARASQAEHISAEQYGVAGYTGSDSQQLQHATAGCC
jgi:hypothetical protein